MRFPQSAGVVIPRVAAVAAGWAWVALVASGVAQEAPAPAGTEGQAEAKPAGDLVTPYRFIERYATPGKAEPGAIGQYRVAYRETIKTAIERARGATEKAEFGLQVICTERPAEVGADAGGHAVASLVRRYDRVRATPDNWSKLIGRPLFDGMTIWYQVRQSNEPLILSLTPGRELTDQEYHVTLRSLFVPRLAYLLPEAEVRVAGTWAVTPEGEEALIAGASIQDGNLTGKLLAVRAAGTGPGQVAVIEVAGRLTTDIGNTALRARLEFAFPAAPEAKPGAEEGEAAAIEARGAIVRLGLAQTTVSHVPDPASPDGRAKKIQRREMILERRPGDDGVPLAVPAKPPEPTKENSWLTYTDLKGRYTFRHPQEYPISPDITPETITLRRDLPGGEFRVALTFLTSGEVKADNFFKKVFDERRKEGDELTVGQATELPSANWGGNRVVRVEAVSPLGEGRGSEAIFAYALHFASRNAALLVEASTLHESPKAFRAEVEEILKSFRLGKPAAGRE